MTATGTPQIAGTTAPPAPGRLGVSLEPVAAQTYLDALGRWRDDRRRELEQLDKAALASPDAASLTGDIMLSMALWKAASDRYDLLVATWDGGRVGVSERERMSSLIWGRLDATLDPSVLARSSAPGSLSGSGLTVSLPEACRLSDALASQLRVRLELDPSSLEVAERLRELRAQMERIRDQVDLEPAGVGQQEAAKAQARFGRRLKEILEKAARGGDVGGLLGPLEIETSTFERDLIVNGALRRQSSALVEQARALRADLKIRTGALQMLVDQCIAAVDPSPNYAVPDIDALGPVPNTAAALSSYLHRLQQVSRAMTHAQDAYTKALRERDELVSRWEGYRAKAGALGLSRDDDLALVDQLARRTLERQPVRMVIAAEVVELYQTFVQAAEPARPAHDRRPPSESK